MFGLLGSSLDSGGLVAPAPLYERTAVETIRRRLLALLDQGTREEEVQAFFKLNPLTLHVCSPAYKIFPKAPILTKYFTDFTIVSPRRELVLVELEKATTRLLTKSGGIAQPLQHAFDQANDWLRVADDHRAALLDSLGLTPKDVASVRAVVICGRDRGYADHHLRALKGRDHGRVTFFTYDDIASSLGVLAQQVGEL